MHRKKSSQKRWFWAWLVEMTITKVKLHSASAQTEVWKNLVIIQASDPDEALHKVLKIGASEAGDCNGTLRLDGKPAVTKFLGVADIGLVYDGLEDGAEILWQLRRCSQKNARSLVRPKRVLLSTLRRDLRKMG